MVKIGVTIISTVNAIAIYGMIVVLEYAPVKWWLRRQSHVLPTLSQVSAQQVLWQKRCDRLLDGVLRNHRNDSKDDAFAQGKGVINAKQSDVYLNKSSPTGNGRNPSCMPMMSRKPCGLGILFPMIIINSDFF